MLAQCRAAETYIRLTTELLVSTSVTPIAPTRKFPATACRRPISRGAAAAGVKACGRGRSKLCVGTSLAR